MEKLGEQDSDIHIVSHAKSGTTLTQMMLYQMTTDGSMDFEHLYDVSPWPGWAISFRLKIKETEGRRLLKSHDPYSFLQHIKKGKFLFLIRNPMDMLVSEYHHHKDYYQVEEDFEDWAPSKLEFWYNYNRGWLENANGLDILYLNYEDTIADKQSQINRIAAFLDIELTDADIARVMERSSFDFMKAHQHKFGEQPNHKKVYDNFIRKGKSGEGKRIASEKLHHYNQELAAEFYKEHMITKRYF